MPIVLNFKPLLVDYIDMFLEEIKTNNLDVFTPTRWQTVILRNYGMVTNNCLAKVLNCSIGVIETEAKRLGVDSVSFDKNWLEKSYLTIIRNNWHLLNYKQLLIILDKDEMWLDNQLKNNDFLWYKLGGFKPLCEDIKYTPLNKQEKLETNRIGKIIRKNKMDNYIKPFDFKINDMQSSPSQGINIAYPYEVECGDIFINDNEIISDDYLEKAKSSGINGLWLHGLLSELSFNKFKKNNDLSYIKRRNNLQKLINKANKFGVKIYLYLNEPRSIKIDEIKEEYLYLSGRKREKEVALCFSFKEVQDYLYDAIKDLLNNIEGLGGFITITASENLTYCKHVLDSDCPHCKDIPSYQTAALINNIIQRAIDDTNSGAILIANLWGWAPYCGFSDEEVKKGIKLLDKKIKVLCVSEFGTHKNININEYSISHGEPCIETISNLKDAKKTGHEIFAKLQINNSWEISTIPYIPVFNLIINHLRKLNKLGVKDFMLSWTLGGYPSVNMNLASSINNDSFDYDKWLTNLYHDDCVDVKKATMYFSKAFKEFPFSQNLLYYSSIQIGPSNLLYSHKTKLNATMVSYPFDDIDSWIENNGEDKFISGFQKMIKIWKRGLKLLINKEYTNVLTCELIRYAKVFLINIESTLNQYLFIKDRNNNKKDLKRYLLKERILTKNLYQLASSDAKIGFEASNQYSYNENSFLEKLINIEKLLKEL